MEARRGVQEGQFAHSLSVHVVPLEQVLQGADVTEVGVHLTAARSEHSLALLVPFLHW